MELTIFQYRFSGTPLADALRHNHLEAVAVLKEYGAKEQEIQNDEIGPESTQQRLSPLSGDTLCHTKTNMPLTISIPLPPDQVLPPIAAAKAAMTLPSSKQSTSSPSSPVPPIPLSPAHPARMSQTLPPVPSNEVGTLVAGALRSKEQPLQKRKLEAIRQNVSLNPKTQIRSSQLSRLSGMSRLSSPSGRRADTQLAGASKKPRFV
jgi:hypothetical protein